MAWATPWQGAWLLPPCYHPAGFLCWGLSHCVSLAGVWGQLRIPGIAQAGSQEAGVPHSHPGLYGESSPQEGCGDRSPLPQEEHWLPAPGTSQAVVLEAGPMGVGAKAACRGGWPKEGPVEQPGWGGCV